ncbi:MAG: hypothetical protein GXP25_24995 [Planctomycetes bacterium]|nr:hypothetical protein [Planctomycetota bacterium]
MSKKRKKYSPIDLGKLKTRSIRKRRNLVDVGMFGKPAVGDSFAGFEKSLPHVLAAHSLRQVAQGIARAHRKGKTIALAFGAHVIKCGCTPIIIDMMQRGLITSISGNGACAIHDFEVALIGATSEDVGSGLKTGKFGTSRETAEAMAEAANLADQEGWGLGRALGELIRERRCKFAKHSLFAAAAKHEIPATVHVAMGTDVVHMHPNIPADKLGAATMLDFRLLCSVVSDLQSGVWLNVGSAVIMPEVFLKALTVARNLGHEIDDFLSVNMDMLQHYRPSQNVLSRPGGVSCAITGHHEIMLPLLRMMVLQKLGKG